jgi:hypothetical protein
MKIIINESQLRLIVENEDKDGNLLDFTPFVDVNPIKWDEMFEFMNQKKGGIYDGYYIDDNIDIRDSSVKEFKHLVRVKGHLKARGSVIESLGKLKKVTGEFDLSDTKNLKSLGNLKYVGFDLDLTNSNIEDLGYLNQVGRSLDLRYTPNLKSLGDVSPEFSKEKFKIYVTDFLMVHRTGLSDEQIDKIKHNWFSKSPYGH